MRIIAVLALTVSLTACGRPAPQNKTEAPPPAPQSGCNDVAINPASPARVLAAAAAADTAQGLLGGPIAPGTYDLVSIEPRDGAPAPTVDTWETVRAGDTEAGIVLEAAIVRGAPTNTPERANVRLTEGPQPALTYTCGRTGTVAIAYAATTDGFQLQLPDESGVGAVLYTFARREG